MSADNTFKGEITVSSRIVDYLSSGLYESPAACLKELINNSYDADASTVNVFVKPDANRIIIEDDGIGMSRDEFEKHFKRISESHKRDGSSITKSGRPKIGKIGIGFIAANEICEVMEIFSTKAGSSELLHVNINFELMRRDIDERKRQGDDVAKADYEGEVHETDSGAHYTKIFLKRVRGQAKEILISAKNQRRKGHVKSLYGLLRETIFEALADSSLKSWQEFDHYSQNLLQIGLNIPVRYYSGWVPPRLRDAVKEREQETAKLGFSVFYDGVEIRKPIVLRPGKDRRALIRKVVFEGSNVSVKGYFFARHGSLQPQNLNGVLLRIRHAAVGSYDPSFLDFPTSEGALFQNWISAEIWADDRLEEAMNIDRKTLRIAHPAYVELKEQLHEELSAFLKTVRTEIYESSRTTQHSRKAEATIHSIKEFTSMNMSSLGKVASREIVTDWKRMASDKNLRKKLIKKFSVEDLYRVVLDVAKEVLTPSLLKKFIRLLTKRLTE